MIILNDAKKHITASQLQSSDVSGISQFSPRAYEWQDLPNAYFSYLNDNYIRVHTIDPEVYFRVGDRIRIQTSGAYRYFYVVSINQYPLDESIPALELLGNTNYTTKTYSGIPASIEEVAHSSDITLGWFYQQIPDYIFFSNPMIVSATQRDLFFTIQNASIDYIILLNGVTLSGTPDPSVYVRLIDASTPIYDAVPAMNIYPFVGVGKNNSVDVTLKAGFNIDDNGTYLDVHRFDDANWTTGTSVAAINFNFSMPF